MGWKLAAALFVIICVMPLNEAFAICKDPDWTLSQVNATFTEKQMESLQNYYDNANLLLRAIVEKPDNSVKDLIRSTESTKIYSFSARVKEVLKGSVHDVSEIQFSYKWELAKTPIATPKEGEEWVFAIDHIYGNKANPMGTRCGKLGFPVKQKKIYLALEKIRNLAQSNGSVPDETSAKAIALQYFKHHIDVKGPQDNPEIVKWDENWVIKWGRVWIAVNSHTGEAYQADSSSD